MSSLKSLTACHVLKSGKYSWQVKNYNNAKLRGSHSQTSSKIAQRWKNYYEALILSGFAVMFAGIFIGRKKKDPQQETCSADSKDSNIYTADDLKRHTSLEKGVWVCYGNSVYDITSFIDDHPGGSVIKLAAGTALEPFWEVFNIHKHSQVYQFLETMKIGQINNEERDKLLAVKSESLGNLWFDTSLKRNENLIKTVDMPCLAETPLGTVTKEWITPNELFYIRNHYAVPVVNSSEYKLSIAANEKSVSFSLEQLKSNFSKHELVATLQCAGNRKTTMADFKPTIGVRCDIGLISNAKWGGVLLSDVLKHIGISNPSNFNHVHFEGLDRDINGENPYRVSIPIEIVLDPRREVLLAYEMNGEMLPPDHGFPLRVIIPGVVGARNVKWLNSITLHKDPSKSFWQTRDYKCFRSQYKHIPPINDTPVTSAIFTPSDSDTLLATDDKVTVEGYAFSGGGNRIMIVEASVDSGKTWHLCELHPENGQGDKWAWTIWKRTVPLPESCKIKGEVEIMCRAMDSSYNVQPNSVPLIWNRRGFLNNTWHKITLKIS